MSAAHRPLSIPPRSTAKQGKVFSPRRWSGYDELPEDADESDDYIDIPHKNDLDLGKPRVMAFVRERCPDQIDTVLSIFRHRGSYGRFKDQMAQISLLEDWYVFEQLRTREALLHWCKESGIVLE